MHIIRLVVSGFVGVLLRYASQKHPQNHRRQPVFVLGIGLGFVKGNFVFRKLNQRNINRILAFSAEKLSLWQFHINRDKLMIVLMILAGSYLRQAPWLHKSVLFPIYTGIGLAMIYVAYLYFFSPKNHQSA